jgi:hypothetical protein
VFYVIGFLVVATAKTVWSVAGGEYHYVTLIHNIAHSFIIRRPGALHRWLYWLDPDEQPHRRRFDFPTEPWSLHLIPRRALDHQRLYFGLHGRRSRR